MQHVWGGRDTHPEPAIICNTQRVCVCVCVCVGAGTIDFEQGINLSYRIRAVNHNFMCPFVFIICDLKLSIIVTVNNMNYSINNHNIANFILSLL